jgi:hypothetical protein
MRATDFLVEGGWDKTVTQSTVIRPAMVKLVLTEVEKFIRDFNSWLGPKHPHVKMGHPTGSSAYHEIDTKENPDKIYGDIDLQIIAPAITPDLSHASYSAEWNRLTDQFIQETQPDYLHIESGEKYNGHPIFRLGQDQYLQVDFMWHRPELSTWGRFRATPERGLKGALLGNLFSALGELLHFSIQHNGVQIKRVQGKIVPFAARKNTRIETVTTNIESFIWDIFHWVYKHQQRAGKPQVAPLLRQNPGVKTEKIRAQDLVNAIKGLAESFELNHMYGGALLENFQDADDFIQKFQDQYAAKMQLALNSSKYDKAASPEAIERAADTKKQLKQGFQRVLDMF